MSRYMLIMLLSVCIASASQLLLKKSAMKRYPSLLREYLNPFVIGGYGLMVLTVLFNTYAYSGMDYKNGPVLESLGNVLVPVLCFVFFKEKLTKRRLLGIVCIVAGMAVFYG